MYSNHILSLALALAAGLVAGPALAGDPPAPEPNEDARICDAYGPGYTVVPGTNTCIKINGFVRMDLNVAGSGSGSSSAPANPPHN